MRIYYSLILFLFACSAGFSQSIESEKQDRKISLKLYGQIMAEVEQNSNTITFPRFNPAVSLYTKNHNFHELELSSLIFRRNAYNGVEYALNTYNKTQFNLGLRYSYNYRLYMKNQLGVYLGAGTNLFYNQNTYSPLASSSFPGYDSKKGFDLNITPRLTWKFNEKWYLDVNIPVNVYQQAWGTSKWDNPAYPVKDSKTITSKGQVFPNQYTVNVGIGLRF